MRGLVPASTPLRTLQATFISPVPGGPLRIVARVLRSGKSETHVEADLYDGGQIACRTLGIFGLPRESALAIAPPPPTVPATVEQARELRYVDGVTPAFTQHLSFRWGGGVFSFRGGRSGVRRGGRECVRRGRCRWSPDH